MARREFQLIEGSARKFWAIDLDGSAFTVQFGRIGTTGQAQKKEFASPEAAQREHDKLIAEKVRKGYSEADGSEPPAPTSEIKAKAASPMVATVQTPQSTPRTPNAPERSIRLTPDDLLVVTWIDHDPLPRPAPLPFNIADARARLSAVGTTPNNWEHDWAKAKIPAFPSREEAIFWLRAVKETQGGAAPSAVANLMTGAKPEDLDLRGLNRGSFLPNAYYGPRNIFGCFAALFAPHELLPDVQSRRATSYGGSAEDFRTWVIPFLSRAERAALRERIRSLVVPVPIHGPFDSFPELYGIAALLGCHEELRAVLRAIPDGTFSVAASPSAWEYFATVQPLIFGLPSRAEVRAEFRRLGAQLISADQARDWIALTELEALEEIAIGTCRAPAQIAARIAAALQRVDAPEAAAPALEISTTSKAPHAGHEWFARHPFHAVLGLAPIATSEGARAGAALEILRNLRRNSATTTAVEDAAAKLPPDQSAWLREHVLAPVEEESRPGLARAELPAALRETLGAARAAKLPGWIVPAALPPVRIGSGRLDPADVALVLAALKSASLIGALPPVLDALKAVADRHSLDAFAWRIFELWQGMGAPSKDRWAMGAIGLLGGDDSVLRLARRVREWPGEAQHARAVFGLECLRAIGTDTALMALNGIAQKVKFKGLQERARALMADIAEQRGLTTDQLADRVVPSAGLDERGSRVFDFGPRSFRFVLGPALKPLVRDAAGKVRPDLPAPNQADDPIKAEAAVAEWKLLKKTLREAFKVQAERLEDAMITGRRWTPEEFDTLLVRHPLMVNLARQLVFAEFAPAGGVSRTFRITEDQSLADQNDAAALPPLGPVGVAHPAQLDDATRNAWGGILGDYEIIPPFPQLGREICRPDPEDLAAMEITRFRGPKIPGIVMYGMLERSQWRRDTPADAGGFMQHSKYFPSANLTAFIAYEPGLAMGYYEQPQELTSVYFVPGHVKPEWWGQHKNRLRIREVDEVVLSEVLRLARAIAAKAE